MSQGLARVRRSAARRLLSALLVLGGLEVASAAQNPRQTEPASETGRINQPVPDIRVTTTNGERLTLSQLAGERSLILTFVFTRCSGVCSPFLRSWRTADRALASSTPYVRLVLSFDPRDTLDDLATLRHHLGASEDEEEWIAAIAAPDDVRRLADAIGFWWSWDEPLQQFDHPAMLAGIRQGRLVRLLSGGAVSPARLDELVREVSGEFVRSYPLPGRVLFRCFQYDPATGRQTLDWGFAILLLPIAATTVATSVLFAAGARRRRGGDRR